MEREVFETLQGSVRRIIYSVRRTGFAVVIMKDAQNGDAKGITLVGNLPQVAEGDDIRVEGKWVDHPEYGKQFSVTSHMKVLPTQASAIEAYLASGLIKGLDPTLAAKIVAKFGDETFEVLSKTPESLFEIPGIGEKKYESITRSWKEQTVVTDIMVFLAEVGITPASAAKIFRQYGLNAIDVIKSNPYQLSCDVDGIGFLLADRIAVKVGLPKESSQRIEAGILYALYEAQTYGHVYLPADILKDNVMDILGLNNYKLIGIAIGVLKKTKRIFIEKANGVPNIYNMRMYIHEKEAAWTLSWHSRAFSFSSSRLHHPQEAIMEAQRKFGVPLSPEQKNAVENACTYPVSVITGGPGTGKSLITKIIVEVFKKMGAKILLAAPTEKAAKRMESCGHEARTIHSMLEYSPMEGGFTRNTSNPLECNVLIVAEFSTADISTLYYLLQAIPSGAHLIIIGDADQLPSMGPGLVMRHITDCGIFPLTVLSRFYRQEEGNYITAVAHDINEGTVPGTVFYGKDCIFIEQEEPVQVVAKVVEIVTKIKEEGKEAMVLSPQRKGDIGTVNLNRLLQEALNPIPEGTEKDDYQVKFGPQNFRINDRVIQLKNNYDKMVFNGDSGVITAMDREERQVHVVFELRGVVRYDFIDLDELSLAYALTVHKAQGSEYDCVIFIALSQHCAMLARNLAYTAVSRARKQCIIIGAERAMAIAILKDRPKTRYTRLKERLATLNSAVG
ncbi:MAG: SF1B family DNA helicase RecD2 [Syntrophorhabdaceae bacterium]